MGNRKEQQAVAKKNASYDHFPFVSGELIEKHRATLGAQLKNDLQSYLAYNKEQSATGAISQTKEGSPASRKSKSTVNNVLLGGKRRMKELFDSDYLKPEENCRVLQDTNPFK